MENNLIVVKQLPVIEEQLHSMKAKIEERTAEAKSLVCTEDNLALIRKVRAELNKEFKEFEERRIQIKKQVFEPYERFDAVFKSCITEPYKTADKVLADKTHTVEDGIKAEKRAELEDYFNEYRTSIGIDDFVTLSDAKINVTLSASKKSLKDAAKAFLDKIKSDIALIETQSHKEEILVEYKKSLDASFSIRCVTERLQAIERERMKAENAAQPEAMPAEQKTTRAALRKPEAMPSEKDATDKIYRVQFTVKGTKIQLTRLREFLANGGYDYE